jgi:hypothetical protein
LSFVPGGSRWSRTASWIVAQIRSSPLAPFPAKSGGTSEEPRALRERVPRRVGARAERPEREDDIRVLCVNRSEQDCKQ